MNTKIFAHLIKKIEEAFRLPKYSYLQGTIQASTVVEHLPWTPARFSKFQHELSDTFGFEVPVSGTVQDIVTGIDQRYMMRFFSEIWKPQTENYVYTGWNLVDEINAQNPQNVLDVGCGFHPFRDRIKNITGIDPYNNCADYMVDILDYKVKPASHDHIIALGSINFNSKDEIESRFSHCVDLLAPGGKFYLRANPGISHKTGPYVEIFPWSFEVVNEFAEKYNLKLLEFKKDANDRLYFAYQKS